jgi:DinB superfamily
VPSRVPASVVGPMDQLRRHVVQLLDWQDAHVGFEAAVAGIPQRFRGMAPGGLPYSPWQLLEHMRLTQHDILEFCREPSYRERHWPVDYWPPSSAPPTAAAWDRSISGFREDLTELKRLGSDPDVDLFAPIPHGNGQTYLRELLLVADHTAYHVGELVVVRRCLGIWKSG